MNELAGYQLVEAGSLHLAEGRIRACPRLPQLSKAILNHRRLRDM
ncbi:MAG TPA: hypothetical protein VFH31_13885 [Pyrinomonadaceae bacterium]|nr:hypothetical protein [Pyrinomonadaceae bacterium]